MKSSHGASAITIKNGTVSFFIFFFKYLFIYLFMWLHRVLVAAHGIFIAVCGLLRCGMQDLVPWPGIEPWTPALGAWSLNHCATREVPILLSISMILTTLGTSCKWNHSVLVLLWLNHFTQQLLLPLNVGGHKWATILTSLMLFLITINMLGLLPYTFTPTTHVHIHSYRRHANLPSFLCRFAYSGYFIWMKSYWMQSLWLGSFT